MRLWAAVLAVAVVLIFLCSNVSAVTYTFAEDGYGTYYAYNEILVFEGTPGTPYYYCTFIATTGGWDNWFLGYRWWIDHWSCWYHGADAGDRGVLYVERTFHPTSHGTKCYMTTPNYPTPYTFIMTVSPTPITHYTISGDVLCLDWVDLYRNTSSGYIKLERDTDESYSFSVFNETEYCLVFSDGAYHDFTCDGNEVFDYDACLYVYGYTCGVGDIHLYVDDGGWVLNDSVSQSMGLSDYEMVIYSGNDYKLNMHGISQLVDTYLFSCTGSHVLHSYDRCVYPPSPSPYYPIDPIILWEGYNYNIVLIRDEHGNYIENAQVAIYDQTNSTYIQRWTPEPDGYMVLGALFNDSDHNIQILTRTFDGVFTLETTYPANGSAPVGSETVTQTNMTIPIHYNIRMETQDQFGTPLTDVFAGLSEYTPLNPLSFWGYSMYGQQYVPVTNCSGFAMCDIYAEKGGYTNYNVTALNWTSRSAMIKDYRHDVTLAKE